MNRSEAVPGQTFLEKKVLCGKENGMAADSQGKQEETSMKVAVVTDSNSGITQAQAKEMGVYVLPMPFMIDGTEYLEDINLTQKEFYEHLSGDHDVSTSQPSPETILNLWEKLLEEYDAVVHIPMSSGFRAPARRQRCWQMISTEKYRWRIITGFP